MLRTGCNRRDFFAPAQILWCETSIADCGLEAQKGDPAALRDLFTLLLIFLSSGDGVDGSIRSQSDDSISRYRQRLQVLPSQRCSRQPDICRKGVPPLQQVAILRNCGAEIPIQLDIPQQLAVEERDPSRRLDDLLIRIWCNDPATIRSPRIDAWILPAPLDLKMLRAYRLPIFFFGQRLLLPGLSNFDVDRCRRSFRKGRGDERRVS